MKQGRRNISTSSISKKMRREIEDAGFSTVFHERILMLLNIKIGLSAVGMLLGLPDANQ